MGQNLWNSHILEHQHHIFPSYFTILYLVRAGLWPPGAWIWSWLQTRAGLWLSADERNLVFRRTLMSSALVALLSCSVHTSDAWEHLGTIPPYIYIHRYIEWYRYKGIPYLHTGPIFVKAMKLASKDCKHEPGLFLRPFLTFVFWCPNWFNCCCNFGLKAP